MPLFPWSDLPLRKYVLRPPAPIPKSEQLHMPISIMRQPLLVHKNILGAYLPSMCIPIMSLAGFKSDSENLNSQAMVLLTLDKPFVGFFTRIIFRFSLT